MPQVCLISYIFLLGYCTIKSNECLKTIKQLVSLNWEKNPLIQYILEAT